MNRLHGIWILIIPVIILSSLIISCSKSSTGKDEDDGNTPYVILDLNVKAFDDSTVTLSWTATGDDANVGTASQYDIRYYSNWINHANWDSATQVTGESKPHPAGQTDTMMVHGLKKDSTYYFAVQACDEANNCSGPSNCVSATCFTDMVVTFPDTNLESVIRTQISKPSGDIYRSDLMAILQINANSRGIANLSGLEYCMGLIEILMADDSVSDLGPVANLIKLRSLQLFNNDISSITPIAGLVNLEKVILGFNSISDISALSGLTKLHELRLDYNNIADIAPLAANAGIAAGDSVYLNGNPLSQQSVDSLIPTLEARGVTVWH